MENFTNSVVLPKDLPEIQTTFFNPLNKLYLTVQIVRIAVVFILVAGGIAAYLLFAENLLPQILVILAAAAILLVILLSTVATVLGFSKKGYLIREKDISYQRGLITFKVTSVPLNRIQHVEVSQGVLAKMLGLSSVKIFTAGGTSNDLSIPGLTVDEAKKVKAYLSGKISEHE